MKTKRIYETTPCGGDYSEIFFLNDDHDIVDEEEATQAVIRECREDGFLLNETWLRKAK